VGRAICLGEKDAKVHPFLPTLGIFSEKPAKMQAFLMFYTHGELFLLKRCIYAGICLFFSKALKKDALLQAFCCSSWRGDTRRSIS